MKQSKLIHLTWICKFYYDNISMIRLLCLIVLFPISLTLDAEILEFDNLWYEINDDGISVSVIKNEERNPIGEIIIPESISVKSKKYVVNEIGTGAFEGCDQITKVVIPSSIEQIDLFAFNNAKNLRKLVFLNSKPIYLYCLSKIDKACVVYVPKGALRDYLLEEDYHYYVEGNGDSTYITEFKSNGLYFSIIRLGLPNVKLVEPLDGSKYEGVVHIPETISYNGKVLPVELDNFAFCDSPNLTELHFSEADSYPNAHIDGCTSLKKIVTGPNVKSLCLEGLEDLQSLEQIVMKVSSPPTIGFLTSFPENVLNNCTLVVPKGAISNYKNCTELLEDGWSRFKNIIEK